MVGVLTATALLMGGLDVMKNSDIKEIKERWKIAMVYAGIKNKSENEQTFELLKVIKKKYGYDCIVSIPLGKSYEDLEKLQPIIQTNMRCVGVTMEWVKLSGCAYVRLITKAWNEKALFEPVKVKPYEVYLSSTEYFQDVISDLTMHPHILISGSTGMGKSVLMFMLALNTIINHKPSDVNIYLAQVSDKKDLRVFRDAEHVKYYADNLEKSSKMYAYLADEMAKRNFLINKYDDVNNIGDYNKKFKNKKLPYIYIFSDEFAFYMPNELDSPQEAGYKTTCLSYFSTLAKQARSAGIFLITGLQRPDKENMPPIFKSLLCTRIAFGQNNTASSLVVIDDGEAVRLEPREAIVLMGNKRYKVKTPYLDMDIIGKYMEKYKVEEDHYIKLDGFNHITANAEKSGNKVLKELKQQNGGGSGNGKNKEKNKKQNIKDDTINANNDKSNKDNETPSAKGNKGVMDICLLKEIDKF